MIRRVLPEAALIAVAVSALSLPALGDSREQRRFNRVDRCADNGGRTLAANRQVRVYVRRDRLTAETMRACSTRTGNIVTLRRSAKPVTDVVPEYRIAGRYLGYTPVYFPIRDPMPEHPTTIPVIVFDVARDKLVGRFETAPAGPGGAAYSSGPPLTDLELSTEGAVAWIARRPPGSPDYFYVQKADGTAAGPVVLDEGTAIDPRSLAISGRRIYWTNGGEPRTARLDGRARPVDG